MISFNIFFILLKLIKMGCDYYIQNEIVIEYLDKFGRLSFIYTNRKIKKGYIFETTDYDSDDDQETCYNKYKAEIEKQIKSNTYNKILFINDEWMNESYRKKYENMIKTEFKEIAVLKKINKKGTAWKNN